MPETKPTLWQRFWRSPWTWLALMLWNLVEFSVVSGNIKWFYFGFALLWGVIFFQKADARWGKP